MKKLRCLSYIQGVGKRRGRPRYLSEVRKDSQEEENTTGWGDSSRAKYLMA